MKALLSVIAATILLSPGAVNAAPAFKAAGEVRGGADTYELLVLDVSRSLRFTDGEEGQTLLRVMTDLSLRSRPPQERRRRGNARIPEARGAGAARLDQV